MLFLCLQVELGLVGLLFGLRMGFEVDTQSYLPGRLVRAQSPAAGASVNKGTKVTLFF